MIILITKLLRMSSQTQAESASKLNMELIIDLVRTKRNELIKQMLSNDSFVDYFSNIFKRDLSKIKTEFVRRELKEMLIHPVDLVHYSKLISQIKETNTSSMQSSESFFYEEINTVLKKYCF
jgi:hypothetical protein